MIIDITKRKLHNVWNGMKNRCYNKNYGGRGITICSEWKDNFQAFYQWSIDNGYKEGLSIDRVDNDKGYSPDNCRWTDRKEQAQNRRTSKMYTINCETHCLKKWCEILNLKYRTIHKRIYTHGWDIETALLTPIRNKTIIPFNKVRFRNSAVWKHKRFEILKRDNYRCKICGNKKKLQVHHIISLDINESLKLENMNLITLCSKCHSDVHNGVYSQVYLTDLVNKKY